MYILSFSVLKPIWWQGVEVFCHSICVISFNAYLNNFFLVVSMLSAAVFAKWELIRCVLSFERKTDFFMLREGGICILNLFRRMYRRC